MKAQKLGLTVEEYDLQFNRRKTQAGVPRNTTISHETRAKISAKLKAKWLDPSFRKDRQVRTHSAPRNHTAETRAKIRYAAENLSLAYRFSDSLHPQYVYNIL
jgi:hypothetical protein